MNPEEKAALIVWTIKMIRAEANVWANRVKHDPAQRERVYRSSVRSSLQGLRDLTKNRDAHIVIGRRGNYFVHYSHTKRGTSYTNSTNLWGNPFTGEVKYGEITILALLWGVPIIDTRPAEIAHFWLLPLVAVGDRKPEKPAGTDGSGDPITNPDGSPVYGCMQYAPLSYNIKAYKMYGAWVYNWKGKN